MVRTCFPWRAPVIPVNSHVAGNLIASDVLAGAAGGFPQFARDVDPIIVLPELPGRWFPGRRPAGPRRADGLRGLFALYVLGLT